MKRIRKPIATDAPNLDDFKLTNREMEIVLAICSGYSDQAIAKKLSMSKNTLKRKLTDVFDKLGIQDRLELVLFVTYHSIVKSIPAESEE